MKFKLFFLFLFLFLFCSGFFLKISAQNRTGITVSPFLIEEIVKPGQIFTKKIIVTNNSDEKKIFYVYVKDIKVKGETGEVFLLPAGSEKFSLINLVEIPEEGIEFNPRESREIPVNFQIPQKSELGGFYGAIIFGSDPPKLTLEEPEQGLFLSFAHQVGILVFLSSPERAIEEMRIREFNTDKKIYNTPFEVNFITRLENPGNVHVKPFGSIKIENMRGRESSVLFFNRDGLNVLPESIRRFESLWQGDFGFGRYTASLFLNFGSPVYEGGKGMQTVFAKTYFWIIPWKMVVIILLILIFIFFFIHFFMKRYEKARQKAMIISKPKKYGKKVKK